MERRLKALLVIFFVCSMGDLVSTLLALDMNPYAREVNPFFFFLNARTIQAYVALSAIKIVVSAIVVLCLWKTIRIWKNESKKRARLVTIGVTVILLLAILSYIFLIVNNLNAAGIL